MSQKKKTRPRISFAPDERNLGGRSYLVDQHFNHLLSLQNMRSNLSSQLSQTPPELARKRGSVPLFKRINEFHEIFETFRRVACVKRGYADTLTPPETLCLTRFASKINNKFTRAQDFEHYLNIASMARRIDRLGSMQERRKNEFDFIAYPAKFFKRAGQFGDSFVLPSEAEARFKQQSRRCSSATLRKTAQRTTLIDDEEVHKWQDIYFLLPIVEAESQNQLLQQKEELAELLAQIMVDQRLYKDEDFLNIKALLCQKNPHLDEDFVHDILQDVYNAFNQ